MNRYAKITLARAALLFVLCGSIDAPVFATIYTWPNPADPPCNGSLQECINASFAYDTVQIAGAPGTTVAIAEDISIGVPLTLTAQAGVDAVFGSGHTIVVNSPASGDASTTLSNLTLSNGSIYVFNNSPDASTYTVENIRMTEVLSSADCAIDVRNFASSSTTSFNIGSNTLQFHRPRTTAPGGICVLGGSGGTASVNIYNNYVRAENASLFSAIAVQAASAAGTVVVSGNTVFGSGLISGIELNQSAGAPLTSFYVHDNWVQGQVASATSPRGALVVTPVNADVHITNNTLVHNGDGLSFYVAGSGSSASGRIANNLVAFNSEYGIFIPATFAGTISNGNDLVFGNGGNVYTPGAGTITLDPGLRGSVDARLQPTSPAIDAGNNADVPGLSADADGENRIANGHVDIGAYEYRGQQTIVHTAAADNTVGNYSDVTLSNVDSGSLLLVTPHHDEATSYIEDTQNVGVYFSGDIGMPWAVYYENPTVPITAGRKFSVTSIGFGSSRFLHASSLSNDTAQFSQLNNVALPNLAGLVLGVTHNFNPGGVSGTYDDERVGFNFQSSHWYLENQNVADDFAAGRYFNVLVEPLLALNAFKATVGSASVSHLVLQHPLLDDNPCAAPQVFRDSSAVVDNTALSVEFLRGAAGAPGHWYIDAEGSGASFPAGAVFNVIVDGAQANACRLDKIFSDGFEAP